MRIQWREKKNQNTWKNGEAWEAVRRGEKRESWEKESDEEDDGYDGDDDDDVVSLPLLHRLPLSGDVKTYDGDDDDVDDDEWR